MAQFQHQVPLVVRSSSFAPSSILNDTSSFPELQTNRNMTHGTCKEIIIFERSCL
jgi:hypothetical protein